MVDKPDDNVEMKTTKKLEVQLAGDNFYTHEGTLNTYVTAVELSGQFTVDPQRYSNWSRLKRVTAWINRFTNNWQKQKGDRKSGELLTDETKIAEVQLIKWVQRTDFKEEWLALSQGKPIPLRSKLLGMKPMLDENGLIRSDGRLAHAAYLSFDVRYPVILPRKSWVTKLIIKEHHEQGMHACGTNHTLAALSAHSWIVSGREAIREWERECMECRRRKAKACQQIMAPLPLARLETSMRAFTKTAVDFAGPFVTVQGRGKRRQKRYLCLFTCMTTRAVHLELAYGLDTDSFMNAFYRMTSRRGLPDEIYSDN